MPRRILFANYEFPPLGGGGSTVCRALARELARRGNEVEVVTAAFQNLPRRIQKKNFRLRRLPSLRKQTGQSNPIEMMSYVAAAAPHLLFRSGGKPDAVISFHSIPSGLAAFPMTELRGVPHVVLFRGGDVPGWLPGELDTYHRMTLWLNRLIVYHSAAALANSDGLRDLAQKSFPKKKIGVLYNGVDLHDFHPPLEGRGERNGPVRLVFLGRITTQKGLDTILEALGGGELKEKNWRLDVAGTGPRLAEYEHLATRLGIADKCRFHGWMDRKGIVALYEKADILVFPSRYEGMPNVVLEAAACGLPIIGTRIAGTEQIVEEGRNGFLVNPDDTAALRTRIGQLVDDEGLRVRLGHQARQLAEEKWSWPARARELEEIIDNVSTAARRARS